MKKLLAPVLLLAAAALYQLASGTSLSTPAAAPQADNATIVRAIEARAEDVWVEGEAKVAKVLPDDNQGSRHQRFIVRLASGHSLLIAHNIDLAPRVSPLQAGDTVSFRGEYVWNAKGGVVHWTHHDPKGRQAGGWIRREGQVFE